MGFILPTKLNKKKYYYDYTPRKKNVLDQLKIVSYINWIHTRYKIFVMRPLDNIMLAIYCTILLLVALDGKILLLLLLFNIIAEIFSLVRFMPLIDECDLGYFMQ